MEHEKKDQDISTLKYTITNMQKALNHIDSTERNINAILTGLPKAEISVTKNNNEEDKLYTYKEKVAWLLRVMECENFTVEMLDKLKTLLIYLFNHSC